MYKIGFDNDKYLKMQSTRIRERICEFGGKLYLEFGGKLFDDYHAARVLPGFEPDSKLQMLLQLKDEAEIVIVVSAEDIEKSKVRSDLGITYDVDALRLAKAFTKKGLMVGSVVLTKYAAHPKVLRFEERLADAGIPVYHHYLIDGYPSNISNIVSDNGYGKNDFIRTERQLVVITAPGPGSGKMAVCLSQLYHENKRGVKAGYAKFETFPIWNLPLRHPVNMAYEAATADLNDINMIDPWHLEAYGKTTVNYNRDVEAFPIVRNILSRISGENAPIYRSPTDMGVNMVGYAITDDEAVKHASGQEIIRRYFKALCDQKQGKGTVDAVDKIKRIMQEMGLSTHDRPVVAPALEKQKAAGVSATAIELPDGKIVTGKASNLMSASSSCVLNAIKALAGIDDSLMLISPIVLEPILKLKINILGSRSSVLKVDDVLAALAITAATNTMTARAMEQLPRLRDCEMHASCMLHSGDEGTLRKLGVRLTCEAEFPSKDLYF